ncbi:hypothetical protein THAOC_28731, partial [Thalassiosira oceanica]
LKLRGHSGEDAGDGDGEGGRRGHGGRGYQSRRGGAPDVGRSVGPSSHRPHRPRTVVGRRRVDGEGRGAVHFGPRSRGVHSRIGRGTAAKGDGGEFVQHVDAGGENALTLDHHFVLVARSLGVRVEVAPDGAAPRPNRAR